MRSLIGKVLDRGAVRNDAPVPYASRRSTGFGGQRAGGSGPLGRTKASGTLFAIVNRTSTRTAAVDWALYRKPTNGKPTADTDREPVGIHAALSLWLQWNPFMTGTQGVEVGQQHIDLAGETFLVIVKVGGVPVEMWPVRPDRMQENPHPTKFLTGWIYKAPDGEKIPLGIDEVIQIKTPDPENPYRGLSPVTALLTDLDAAAEAARWNANFFANSAQPGGIIEVPEGLDDDQFDQMTERWREQHQGTQNAHRVAIIEYGTWKDRSFSPKDLDFSALRNLNRDALLEGYGMSRTSLGITDGVNFAAAKAARWQVAEDITVPRVERWKAALNGQLLPMFGTTGKAVEFDYESPVPADDDAENADRTSRVTAVATLVKAGFNAASAAEAYGLPEIQFGNGKPDPDRDLMVQLVTAAPAALAPMLLPILLPNVEFPSTTPAEPAPDDDEQDPPPDQQDDQPAPGGDPVEQDDPAAAGVTQDEHELAARAGTSVCAGGCACGGQPADAAAHARACAAHGRCPHGRTEPADVWAPIHGEYALWTPPTSADDGAPEVDLTALQAAWEAAVEAILARWDTITAAQRAELRQQIAAAVDDDDLAQLAALTAGLHGGDEVLAEALEAMARVGASHVVAEAAAASVVIAAVEPPVEQLQQTAQTVAALLAAAHALTAGQEAVRVHRPGMTGAQVATEVDTHLRAQSDRPQRDALGGALTGAQNGGMRSTYAAASEPDADGIPGPVGSLYASEVNDQNRCKPCAAIDGRFICTTDDMAAHDRLYTALGGYVDCLGGVRCRGTTVGAWRPATVDDPEEGS